MEKLFEIDNDTLDSYDMGRALLIDNLEYQKYYKDKSSIEHYRFLTYLSLSLDYETFLDVGTFKGCSALALSTNINNKVFSFNLVEQKQLSFIPPNCEFIINNVINGKYDDLILKSKVILLDTLHDGVFEIQFLNHLQNLNYKGVLVLDDIKLNYEMISFWNSIELPKKDITHLGHATGTGVVYFD
jgi:hypothetical protein